MIHKLGLGTYRVANDEHYQALKYALSEGIRFVDSSANYMDGEAEKLIGRAIKELNISRAELTVITKGGYIQGQNYKEMQDGLNINELVRYEAGCFHSIHKDFLAHQIGYSLFRMKLDYIDIYLLHNPEYYLLHNIKSGDDDVALHQKEMQRRIKEAFFRLEIEVKIGRIISYGISSNSFSKKSDDIHFLEYRDLIEYAKEGASIAGNSSHSFKAIQLPMNLLEQEGSAAARWAKENNIKVIVNRPFNAFSEEKGMLRLAEYEDIKDYDTHKNALLLQNSIDGTQKIGAIVEELDKVKDELTWCGTIDDILFGKFVPYVNKEIQNLSHENLDHFIGVINRFVFTYRQHAFHTISKKTKEKLGISDKKLEEEALCFLLKNSDIDVVLVGARKKEYVDSVIKIASKCSN